MFTTRKTLAQSVKPLSYSLPAVARHSGRSKRVAEAKVDVADTTIITTMNLRPFRSTGLRIFARDAW